MKCRYCDFENDEWHLERHLNKEHKEQRKIDKQLLHNDLTSTFYKQDSYRRRGRNLSSYGELTRVVI